MKAPHLRVVLDDDSVPPLYLGDMALDDFRRRVKRWANAFAPRYRVLMYALGNVVELDTTIATVKIETLKRKMQESLERQGATGVVPLGKRAIQYRLAELRTAGVLESWQPRKVTTDMAGVQRFRAQSNRYAVDFTRVLAEDGPQPHNFLEQFDPNEIKRHRPINCAPSDAPGNAPSDAPIPCRSPSGPASVSHQADNLTDTGHFASSTAEAGPSAMGARPRIPENDRRPTVELPDGFDREDWSTWRTFFGEMAMALGERYGTEFDPQTLAEKFTVLSEYLLPDDDGLTDLHQVGGLLNRFHEQKGHYVMGSKNPAAYVITAFPAWVSDNYCTAGEVLKHDAEEVTEIASEVRVFN